MKARHLLGLIVVLLIGMSPSPPFARQAGAKTAETSHTMHHHPATSAEPNEFANASPLRVKPASLLRVAVDGATDPEAVPDDLAYRHFLMALAVARTAPSAQVARRDALLATVSLSAADQAAMKTALIEVRERLDHVSQRRRQFTPESVVSVAAQVALVDLRREENEIIAVARARVESALSVEGFVALDRHIQDHVKRRIVIYGDAPR